MTYEELRSVLIARRKQLGWGQRKAAKAMGLLQSQLCELENGTIKSPKLLTLARWTEGLGLTVRAAIRNGVVLFWFCDPREAGETVE